MFTYLVPGILNADKKIECTENGHRLFTEYEKEENAFRSIFLLVTF